MPHALVEGYLAERDQLLNTINVFKNTAADQNRDPSDPELETMQKAMARIDKLDELIRIVGEDKTMDAEAREKLTRETPPSPGGVKYRSAGDMMWDCLHANFGSMHDHDDQDAKRRWDIVMKRAAQHMGTDADVTAATAGDVGGLYVVPIVGPVIDLSPRAQPFLSAIGKTPAPNSMTFVRPRLVDADFATGAAKQATEKAELASKKFDVKVDTVTLDTYGGYLNVSQQLMSMQAGAWNLILQQLQKRVANQGETAVLAELDNTTNTVDLPAASQTDATAVLKALFDGASQVYAETNELPTWIAFGPLAWAFLGALTDAADRPLFPFLGAANALGSASLGDFGIGPLGLRQILTPGIADASIYMGNDLAIEAYAYSFPILEAVEPSLLGRQVAVAEALAFYRPTTGEGPPAEKKGAVRIYDVTP